MLGPARRGASPCQTATLGGSADVCSAAKRPCRPFSNRTKFLHPVFLRFEATFPPVKGCNFHRSFFNLGSQLTRLLVCVQPRASGGEAAFVAQEGSTWRGVARKLRRLLPFLWPRGDRPLQLTVLLCLALLAGTRVTNVYVPLYYKYIGQPRHTALIPPSTIGLQLSNYFLIIIMHYI